MLSPSYQQSSRAPSTQRRSQPYGREKHPTPWSTTPNYQDEPVEGRDFPSLMPPTNPLYSTFNAPVSQSFQSPTDEQYDERDRDFRPPYHRSSGEIDNNGGDSPSDGLQIDENA
jgi:hypothetical protein